MRTTPNASSERAFTLIELLAVVTIVGILATIGLVAYRRFTTSAKAAEALYMVGQIRASQESYRAETLQYLNVSSAFGTAAAFYPVATVGAFKTSWDNPSHADYNNWRALGAQPDGPVYYSYKVAAGTAGGVPPALDITSSPTWPTTTEPWYVIEAKGDVNGNGTFSWAAGTSFTGQIYLENEGE